MSLKVNEMSDAAPSFKLRIEGIECAEEISLLRRALGSMLGGVIRSGGVIFRGIVLLRGRFALPFDRERLKASIDHVGLCADLLKEKHSELKGSHLSRTGVTLLTLASGLLAAAGALSSWIRAGRLAAALGVAAQKQGNLQTMALLICVMSILAGTWPALLEAWPALYSFAPT